MKSICCRSLVKVDLFVLIMIIGSVLLFNPSHGQLPTPKKIGMETFKSRRQALMDSLQDGVAVLYSQGRDAENGYRADGDFWYLTGIDEAGAFIMLAPGEHYRQILYLPPRDPASERWSGWLPDVTDSLKTAWGFDDIRRQTGVGWRFTEALKHSAILHLISQPVGLDDPLPPDLELYHKATARMIDVSIENSSRFLESMRMIKSPEEIAAMEKAITVTHLGIGQVIGAMKPGMTEYQLEAALESSFKDQGSQYMAFDAIIAAGGNSHFLHYQKCQDTLRAGQLLLMDVGAEWDRYSADISRTFPVDGRFTSEQAEIYDLVLKAQRAAIEKIRPGVTYYEIDEAARTVFREAGHIDDYWHSTGHHLGIDTHDPADYGMPLESGMVITVEPGIYLPDMQFGIRIEDDVLVTDDGYRVLSAQIPKEREEVEAWISAMRQY